MDKLGKLLKIANEKDFAKSQEDGGGNFSTTGNDYSPSSRGVDELVRIITIMELLDQLCEEHLLRHTTRR